MTVIVSALRTAIGKFNGSLSDIDPEIMLSHLFQNNLSEIGNGPEVIDEIIIGHTKQSAHNPNIARVASLIAKFPESVPSYTVHKQCGSGLQAVINGHLTIKAGENEAVIAGGVENMSQAPYYFHPNRKGIRPGNITLYDSNTESQMKSQPEDIYGRFNMGMTAETLAEKYNISRMEQDEFALMSQHKAHIAINEGRFEKEIVPIEYVDRKSNLISFSMDEFPRQTSMEKLSQLKPVFKENGTVTAGNSTGRNDGAASVILMSRKKADELGLKSNISIKSFGLSGIDPRIMGLGPVKATKKALKKAGLTIDDLDLIEINEAFAAQTIAVLKELDIKNYDKVNVNGGAIALGHPLGCSGTRILVTLAHELERRGGRFGLATLCIAGGQGIAVIIENNLD